MRKTMIIVVASAFLVLVLTGIVFATEYQLLCLSKGQSVKFSKCNPAMPDYSCLATSCTICASLSPFNSSVYCTASPNACNYNEVGCESINTTDVDTEPPVISILSPIQGNVYTKRSTLLSVSISETSNIIMLNLLDSGAKWTQVCSTCTSYSQLRNFNEGRNFIAIKATDGNNNFAIRNTSFFIDTINPKVQVILPNRGFTNGSIHLEFKEINPKSLTFYYGLNGATPRSYAVDINSCLVKNDKYTCDFKIDMLSLNNRSVSYYATLFDIANKNDTSRPIKVSVDAISPIMNSFSANKIGTKLNVTISVMEDNFDSVKYIDNNSKLPRWTTICSSLKNNVCSKLILLSTGAHSLDFKVSDKAGNTALRHIDITI